MAGNRENAGLGDGELGRHCCGGGFECCRISAEALSRGSQQRKDRGGFEGHGGRSSLMVMSSASLYYTRSDAAYRVWLVLAGFTRICPALRAMHKKS